MMELNDMIEESYQLESSKRLRTHYSDGLFKPIAHSPYGSSYGSSVASSPDVSSRIPDHRGGSHNDSNMLQYRGNLSQRIEAFGTPENDLDDNFIESMLIGLKENKKILIPSYVDRGHATSNPIAIPARERRYSMTYDSVPSSPMAEDRESSPMSMNTSPNSSLRSSPTPIADLTHMAISTPTPSSSASSSASSSFMLQDKTRDTRWKEHFQELTEFKRDYGHTNVTQTKSKTLAEWVKNQRRLRKAGKLAQNRITKLDEIGFEWDRSYLFKNKRGEPTSQSSPGSNPRDIEHTSVGLSRKRKNKSSYDPSSDGDLDYDS